MNHQQKKLLSNIIIALVILSALFWVLSGFIHLGRVEYTDNAQIKQQIVPINSRVQGFIRKIYFEEYQKVKKGDTLVVIEDAEMRLLLAQAEANYQNALAGKQAMGSSISTIHNNISVSDAAIQEAEIRLQNAQKEFERYQDLLSQDAVTQQQYDAVKTDYDAMRAKYEMLIRQRKSTELSKEEQEQRLNQNIAAIELAQAQLNLARLNLSYTVITAPFDGTTGRKNVQEGELIQLGQTLLDLVDDHQKWVIANYKETQTAHIHEGLDVDIEVDAVPGVVFKGKVKSISQATGASFSLIPQDNSAGNFVKIQQRIPIRIEFTDQNPEKDMERLRAGMNVECHVRY